MPTRQSGFLLQSSVRGNFELVIPSMLGGFVHRARRNDLPELPWDPPVFFGSGAVSSAALMESTGEGEEPGYLEMLARHAGNLVYYCREDEAPFRWFGPFIVRRGVFGNPALIVADSGNFEAIAPLAAGGMAHLTRDNADLNKPWRTVSEFGGMVGLVDGVALIQSSFGAGNLELVANVVRPEGNALAFFWCGSEPGAQWSEPSFLFAGEIDPAPGCSPTMIQSRFGDPGNFELLVPLRGGGLAHLTRNNSEEALSWSAPAIFGEGEASAVALFQSNIGGGGGNLEAAAQVGSDVHFYFRGEQDASWFGPSVVTSSDIIFDSPTQGQWTVPYSSPVVGIHSAVTHTGKVVLFCYHADSHGHGAGAAHTTEMAREEGISTTLDPVSGESTEPVVMNNIFCAGQAIMPDGRLLAAGGGAGNAIDSYHAFTPEGEGGTWRHAGFMTDQRWYPTVTAMLDGRMLIISGTRAGGGPESGQNLNATYEIFDPATNTRTGLTPAPFLNEATPFALYPFCYHLPDGRMLVHAGRKTSFLDVATGAVDAVTALCVRETPRTYRLQGTSVMLALVPDSDPPYRVRVMAIGGGDGAEEHDAPATNTCEMLDLGADPLEWRAVAPMQAPRVMCDSVLLPDGTVLVTNGSAAGLADDGAQPVFQTEIYDPATDRWSLMAGSRVPRLYHSTAFLLPDARVMTAGTDEDFNPEPFKTPELRLEVFSPPYLFRGPRPVISSGPSAVAYGAEFSVNSPNAASIASACLIRPGAVSHSFNMSQRMIGLRIVGRAGGRVRLQAPPREAAPPGFHMLFVLNEQGVPSIALWVKLG